MVTDIINPISVLIVDDENKACTNLKNMIHNYVDETLNVVGFAHNTQEASEMLKKLNPDAVFLDIHMPHGNVFEMLENFSERNFQVIFVTAYDEYAIKAFRLNALDYILKPISLAELKNAVQRLKEKIAYKRIVEDDKLLYADLNNQITNKQTQSNITFKGTNSIEIVNFKDIYFVEAHSSYSRIVFIKDKQSKEMTMSNPLSEYEEILPENMFFRAHKSYLVNCARIKRIENRENHIIILSNDMELPVSRRRYGVLLDFLRQNKYDHE